MSSPNCGGTMKVLGFIARHQADVIQRILPHCGLWKDVLPRPPPTPVPMPQVAERDLDYEYFDRLAG